ncbi:MAG: carbohydrate ABC transporter permease [Propionibacteriaceae bacterium]|jgi:multiple sugar transport system permease protein|nr:carbohydrate ABC transporter permease [Propionibacteriaceae bacterium]
MRVKHARVRAAAWYVAATLISVVTVFPLVWTVLTSVRPESEILSAGFRFLPRALTLDNYRIAFREVPFPRYLLNSLILGTGGTLLNLVLGSLAGYAFARLAFRFREQLFWLLISAMMVPGVITMIPWFLILHGVPLVGGNDLLGRGGVGLINTFWAVILPGAAGPFATFMMRQQFGSVDGAFAEAARLDGAGEFRIFARIYLPLVKPGLAVLAILTFQAGWNNFLWPLIVLNTADMMPIQVGLAVFRQQYETAYGPLMAGTLIACVPVILIFVFFQRWIIEGATSAAIK